MQKQVVVIGYSGHSYVVIDILMLMGIQVKYYLEKEEKKNNPFNLNYKGTEIDNIEFLKDKGGFVAIGDNAIRETTFRYLNSNKINLLNAIHPASNVSSHAKLGRNVMIGAGANVNSLAEISDGVIVNTGAIVEHECKLENFVHIAPGAVINGNVEVGAGTFVGANSVIKQGIIIGKNVIIGAGTVVIKNIPDNTKIVGNPQRIL
ncbi:MAG: acetyltransferase [Cytophagaceae bacterium]|nr:acetyltransferase [Cytophagaceae bacterium]